MYTTLFRYAYRQTRNWHDAEDIAQQAILECLATGRGGEIKLAQRAAKYRVYNRKRQINQFTAHQEGLARPLACEPDPDREESDRVTRAMGRLIAEDRDVLVASIVDGLKAEKLAKRLRVNRNLARWRKRRALQALKAEYLAC